MPFATVAAALHGSRRSRPTLFLCACRCRLIGQGGDLGCRAGFVLASTQLGASHEWLSRGHRLSER
jgi:hypothetical protein